jgi:hypothetical protein
MGWAGGCQRKVKEIFQTVAKFKDKKAPAERRRPQMGKKADTALAHKN